MDLLIYFTFINSKQGEAAFAVRLRATNLPRFTNPRFVGKAIENLGNTPIMSLLGKEQSGEKPQQMVGDQVMRHHLRAFPRAMKLYHKHGIYFPNYQQKIRVVHLGFDTVLFTMPGPQ